jgi:hypothetical protein
MSGTSTYPTALDNLAANKTDGTPSATDHPAHHNALAAALNAVQAALGVNLVAVRGIPINTQSAAYVAAAGDAGGAIYISAGGVTIAADVFAANQVFNILNNSGSNQTITQGAGVTLRRAGTTNTGNRTLAPNGVAAVICVAPNVFYISGDVS